MVPNLTRTRRSSSLVCLGSTTSRRYWLRTRPGPVALRICRLLALKYLLGRCRSKHCCPSFPLAQQLMRPIFVFDSLATSGREDVVFLSFNIWALGMSFMAVLNECKLYFISACDRDHFLTSLLL